MRTARQRFVRWLRRDDDAKEHFLAEVGGSYVDDATAVDRVNRDQMARHSGLKAPITEAMIRLWARDDPEFAQALKVARQHRDEARRLGHDKPPTFAPPEQWLGHGRLDTRPDPYRVANDVHELLGGQK